jgi:hypothetical protein
VIDGQPLTPPVAVLAGVAVAPQDVLLVEGHAVEERLADEDGEPDHRRQREHPGRRADHAGGGLDGLGLAGQQQRHRPAGIGEMQRLVRGIEHEYCNLIHICRTSIDAGPHPVK